MCACVKEYSKLGGLLAFFVRLTSQEIHVSFSYDPLNSMLFKINGKYHNSQTQQYFYSILILYHYGLHVSNSIESSSGPQDGDPTMQ